ncbi:polysaccharide deacetylase family protein [Algoriphagus vanfongensis]|uniref:polysaccharide deacetylase family protein n=1 Tax=Algoriphagus vanfongensis TaxID=426371 RepID=UPI0004235C69|nr:polysaccharide deacetylase family protein [Algoriphagus vanfongensis]
MPLFHKTPALAKWLFPQRIWEGGEKKLYLTFDDGPVPGATDYVLNELAKRKMKASFFVVGDNVRKYPDLARDIQDEGHAIGNHTYNHLLGIKTPIAAYLANVRKCDQVIQDTVGCRPTLFRPPYGWMKSTQAREIAKTHDVIMWSLLTGDYDPDLSAEHIAGVCKKYARLGSIVLFHDQEKTRSLLPLLLPDVLDFIGDQGWETNVL